MACLSVKKYYWRIPLKIFNLTRRHAILGGAALGGAASLSATPLFALSKSVAEKLVADMTTEILTLIESGQSEEVLLRKFESVFKEYADLAIISRSALGISWRSASDAQKKAFQNAFTTYLSRKYGRRFREFLGGKIAVTGSSKTKRGVAVTSDVRLEGQSPFEVIWQVSDLSGRPLMFDLYIEGISMLITEKGEIGAMFDKRGGNLDKLIADLGGAG